MFCSRGRRGNRSSKSQRADRSWHKNISAVTDNNTTDGTPTGWVGKAQKDSAHCVTQQDLFGMQTAIERYLKIDEEQKFMSALAKDPSIRIVAKEWYNLKRPWETEEDKLARLRKDNYLIGYVPTCRYTEQPLIVSSAVSSPLNGVPSDTKPMGPASLGTRVALLHMNYIRDVNGQKRYIVCQAPRGAEMQLFLQTMMQEKVEVMICLVNDFDFARERVYDYFIHENGKERSFGSMKIKCLYNIQNSRDLDIRRLEIKDDHTNVTHAVIHIHYKRWTDFCITADVEHIVRLKHVLEEATKEGILRQGARILVHCSAGLGRSGALVISFVAFDWIQQFKWPLNTYAIVKRVRKQRYGAVQTAQQYALLYCVMAEFLKAKEKRIFNLVKDLSVSSRGKVSYETASMQARLQQSKDKNNAG